MHLLFLALLSAIGGHLAGQTIPADGPGRVVATGQALRPAGEAVAFGGRPVDLALSPDGRTVYVKDNRGIMVLDAGNGGSGKWVLRQEYGFPSGGGSMHGIAVSKDGARVYATNAENELFEAVVGADGRISWTRTIKLPGPGGSGASDPCGIALSAEGARAYVCLGRNNTLGVVDLKAGRLTREIPVGVAPWDVALSPDGRTAWVSNWGGQRPKPGERAEKSSGTETLVDERGIAISGTASCVDLEAGKERTEVATGLHSCDIALSPDGATLYTADANSDTVSVVDTRARRLAGTIRLRPDPALPFGSAPTGLALADDGRTLYVALGGNNAVAVVALSGPRRARGQMRGYIPVGWYPGAVATDGRSLFVANVKGDGGENRPASAPAWNSLQHRGTVSRVAIPDAPTLRRYTAQVRADARVPEILRSRERARASAAVPPVPVPARAGQPSVFEHVVYVIKENRTYDQVFGDLKQGNGDPKLCIFGREVSPNHHALAEQFVLLDNFYCNGVLSADGHSWATEANVTDHLEKSFGGFTRSYTWGDDPLNYSSSGFLWDNVLLHGLSFRNYGEMDYAEPVPKAGFKAIYDDWRKGGGKFTFQQNIGIARLREFSCRAYPGWNTGVPDVLRADIFLKELREYEKKGTWPSLVIVYLGNDHTTGTAPGYPTPRAQVADNDLALGRVVEGISKSRFWPKTCIFVIEDDPQNGFDHVDGHRSLCLVASPYTRRGAVVSRFYNQTSVIGTMERMLGLPSMTQFDALSPLMADCFTGTPDLRPYAALPNRVALDEMNPPATSLRGPARLWAQRSAAMDFRHPDEIDDDTLNRVLWSAARGPAAPYPARR